MKFKDFREKYGTQEEFAKLVGIKRSTVSMWEIGASFPKIKTARKVARIMQIPVDDFYLLIENQKGE